MFAVKMSYSWEDQEPIRTLYSTAKEAFKAACHLAAEEAFVQNEEMEPDCPCTIIVDAGDYAIDLHYQKDETFCHYRVLEVDEKSTVESTLDLVADAGFVDGVLHIQRKDGSTVSAVCKANFVNRSIFALPQEIINEENIKSSVFVYTDADGETRALVAKRKTANAPCALKF